MTDGDDFNLQLSSSFQDIDVHIVAHDTAKGSSRQTSRFGYFILLLFIFIFLFYFIFVVGNTLIDNKRDATRMLANVGRQQSRQTTMRELRTF